MENFITNMDICKAWESIRKNKKKLQLKRE
jgi:hypothetical protein